MRHRLSLLTVVVSATLVLLSILNCSRPAEKARKIDEFMTYCYENGMFNGTVLVAENGNIIYNKAFGFSHFETGDPLRTDSPFYIGSMTKPFTTMAVMILNERKKLKYDDKLSKYFPEFPAYADQVTIQHLMTHTSGIPDYFKLMGVARPGLTNRDVFNVLIRLESLDFKPGERYQYSNSGYILLAMIVEKASGQPHHVFMKENVFDPLEMNQSLVYDESKPDIPGRTIGHGMYGEKWDYDLLTYGEGGIYSTTGDLFKWDQALYTEKLVSAETLNEAFTPYKLNNDSILDYGYGWSITEDETGKTVSHDGGYQGFRTYIVRRLDSRKTIILLTNKGPVKPGIFRTAAAIRHILEDKPYELPRIPVALKMNEIINEKNIGAAIDQYHVLKESQSDRYDFSEDQLNSLVYYLLDKKQDKEAIEIFRLKAAAYLEPSSPNYGPGFDAEKETIRKLTTDLSAAYNRRDIQASLSYLAPEAVIQLEGVPIEGPPTITGTTAMRAMYEEIFKIPYTDLVLEPRTVVLAASGDLAYETGTLKAVIEGSLGRIEAPGKLIIIWRKFDSQWKAVVMNVSTD